MSEKKYPIGGYAPGNYHNRCSTCERSFFGDKRATQCEPCALEAKARFDKLDPNEQELLIKRNARIANFMFNGPLSPERDLIYRIVEQWGNAIEMPNMEQWLKDYAATRLAGPVWVKASERLPGVNTLVKWRLDGIERGVHEPWYMVHAGNSKILSSYEWYDESGTAAASAATTEADISEANGYIEFLDIQNNRLRKMLSDVCAKAEYGKPVDLALGTKAGSACIEIERMIVEFFKEINAQGDESPAEQPVISQDAHEKEIIMQAFNNVRRIFEGREWIMEGRGSYPYNDDRYKEEVRYIYNEFNDIVDDTWNNIESKSADYRKAIIEEHLNGVAAEQPGREGDKDILEFIRDVAENWDCDEDGHKYNTGCRKCEAKKLYQLFKEQKEK